MAKAQEGKTLILMADSRSPLAPDLLSAPYYSLATAINLRYAQLHQYDFRFYQFSPLDAPVEADASLLSSAMTANQRLLERARWTADVAAYALFRHASPLTARRPSIQARLRRNYRRARRLLGASRAEDTGPGTTKTAAYCRHPEFGERSAPWGKLPAIEVGLAAGYSRVVYIDSDAVFTDLSCSIDDFLARSTSTAGPLPTADLVVMYSVPFVQEEANSGFMIWQNRPSARQLLSQWWHTDAGGYHRHHDYEQAPLKHTLLPNAATRARIAVVPEPCFMERKGQLVRHVCSPHGVERMPRFRLAAARAGIDERVFDELLQTLEAQHLQWVNCSDVSFATSPQPASSPSS